jgi:hypothetical protein
MLQPANVVTKLSHVIGPNVASTSWFDKSPVASNYYAAKDTQSGFGGLGVACWPLVPKFAGSNPAESVGFLMAKKSSARLPSEI